MRGLEIFQTTGDHHSMVTEEHAAELARQMNLILDRNEAARKPQATQSILSTPAPIVREPASAAPVDQMDHLARVPTGPG
jgi:hypothetical protein